MKFVHLIQNEMMKINAKKQTVLFFSLLAVLVLLAGLVGKLYATDLTNGIGYAGFSIFMHIGLSFLITLFGLVVGAQILTDEYKEGTIKQLLIRPSSRTTILLSKYVTVLIMLVAATLFLLLFSSLVGLIFFGTKSMADLDFNTLLQGYIYSIPALLFLATLSFFTATIFKTNALAISVAIIANFSGSIASMFTKKYVWGKFVIFNHLDLNAYSHNPLISRLATPAYPELGIWFSLMIIIIYIALMVFLSILIFKKRDVQ
ncbi:hypothetical protein EEL32_14145 [Brevibacillus laterosporus]|uniref:Uncharacterized protein n=1 Tax=Brevibacillus laterosporus TaxID=1465 RepID=A0A502IGB1_BRELA|nr:DUF2705 family protein [Brevibacillus laterosporus]QDX91731.1 hypothetical protein EEL30_04700 [Brevibacillus laterosporus]RAP22605.1 hypothetical protein C2W64_03509 [Brevibacillus laterosporus]TPG70099.1 hypothetical protein EEL31_17475 [Brevibacillus laterosporus]TPG85947.1 hypothetical protein EEL32_14145 [Brevibacillus laterosporus]